MKTSAGPITLAGFGGGVDNRSYEHALAAGVLRDARNTLIAKDGTVTRRDGYTAVDTGSYHSLWSGADIPFALAVKGSDLVAIHAGLVQTTVATIGSPRAHFAELNGEVFFTNGLVCGRVSQSGAVQSWGLPVPATPTVSGISSGGMTGGTYQVTVTCRDATGLESGAPGAVLVTVPDGGGIQLQNVVIPSQANRLSVYLSDVNGANFHWHSDCYVGQHNMGQKDRGRPLETLLCKAPIPGQLLCQYRGQLVVASANHVWWTLPMQPHVMRPRTHSLSYSSNISMLRPVADGIFVASGDKTYFLSGVNPREWIQTELPAKGCATSATLPSHAFTESPVNGPVACWLALDGQVWAGFPGGLVKRVADNLVLPSTRSGNIGYLESRGIRYITISEDNTGYINIPADKVITETFSHD